MPRVRRRKAAVKRGSRATDHDREIRRRKADLLTKLVTEGLTPEEAAERSALGDEAHARWREGTGR